LRKGCYIKKDWLPAGEGFRLKTVRLRGQVSQGLVVPVGKLRDEFTEGSDVTETLQVVKWDPPVASELRGQPKGNFPSFVPKTDQERVQNCYSEIPPGSYVMEEKLEGSSCTVYFNDGVFGVCSRNFLLSETEFIPLDEIDDLAIV
jgi:RNA ligase (TIGR02306 family)